MDNPAFGFSSPMEPIRGPVAEEEPIPVLFIEDDPSVAEVYRLKLEVDGYQVTITSAESLIFGADPVVHPDLIFLDIRAPHRNREKVLRRLRALKATKGVPVVIVSDYSPQELRDAGIKPRDGEYYLVNFAPPSTLSPTLDAWTQMERLA